MTRLAPSPNFELMSANTTTPSRPGPRCSRPQTRHLLALALVVIFAGALWPRTARAGGGILLAITEVDSDGSEVWWWETPEEPAWSHTDQALRTLLSELDLAVIDPAALPDAPSVSRVVYGTPHLSPNNALNLGSLFGASRVITGEVRFEALPPSPVFGETGVRAHVDLHVFSTTTTIELLPIQLTEEAWGDDVQSARADALVQGVERMRLLFEHTSSLNEAQVGIQTDEPVLVITGLTRAAPLVEMKKLLKSRSDVQDAVELWAAEGVIAVEVNPGTQDPPELVSRAVDELLGHSFDSFLVQEISRTGNRIEVNVTRKLPTEASTSR